MAVCRPCVADGVHSVPSQSFFKLKAPPRRRPLCCRQSTMGSHRLLPPPCGTATNAALLSLNMIETVHLRGTGRAGSPMFDHASLTLACLKPLYHLFCRLYPAAGQGCVPESARRAVTGEWFLSDCFGRAAPGEWLLSGCFGRAVPGEWLLSGCFGRAAPGEWFLSGCFGRGKAWQD